MHFPFYPQGIRLTGVDLSPAMLQLAGRQADRLGLDTDLRVGDAQALDVPDASFDTAVCILLDHVAAAPRWLRAVQWLLERITVPLGGTSRLVG